MSKCPGQDSRNVKVCYVPCPACHYLVELFSDEISGRCPKCRAEVSRETLPACVEWCAAARDCLGAEKYDALLAALKKAVRKKASGTRHQASGG